MSGNREYKSDVFSMLMEDPARALQLYNAVNGTTYDDPAQVEIKTLDGGISLSIRNDAAFIVDARLSIYEHQSTICPNMPIRSLIYFTTIVQEMVRDRNIYGRKLIPIPMPQFVVFYNGDANQPERQELHLSDAFAKETDNPQLELKCQVYNINKGYADFKEIIILYQNDEYSIVESNTRYGLNCYDYIALDASTVVDNQFIYE